MLKLESLYLLPNHVSNYSRKKSKHQGIKINKSGWGLKMGARKQTKFEHTWLQMLIYSPFCQEKLGTLLSWEHSFTHEKTHIGIRNYLLSQSSPQNLLAIYLISCGACQNKILDVKTFDWLAIAAFHAILEKKSLGSVISKLNYRIIR